MGVSVTPPVGIMTPIDSKLKNDNQRQERQEPFLGAYLVKKVFTAKYEGKR